MFALFPVVLTILSRQIKIISMKKIIWFRPFQFQLLLNLFMTSSRAKLKSVLWIGKASDKSLRTLQHTSCIHILIKATGFTGTPNSIRILCIIVSYLYSSCSGMANCDYSSRFPVSKRNHTCGLCGLFYETVTIYCIYHQTVRRDELGRILKQAVVA
jgi:hypothetical protein